MVTKIGPIKKPERKKRRHTQERSPKPRSHKIGVEILAEGGELGEAGDPDPGPGLQALCIV
jgi:hypothetical protein